MFTHSIGVTSWKSQASKSGDECAPLLLFVRIVRIVPVVGSVRACGVLQRADIDPLSLCSEGLSARKLPLSFNANLPACWVVLFYSALRNSILCRIEPRSTSNSTFAWEQHHAFRADKNYQAQMHFFMLTSKSQSSCFGVALRISYRRGYDPAATLSRCTGSSGTLRTSRGGMFCQSTRPFDADPRTGRNSRCRIDRAASGRADVHRSWHRDRGTWQSDPRCSARPDRLGST